MNRLSDAFEPHRRAPAVLIGREPERERIDTLIAAVRSGQSGALAIHGEPGVGKTSLLEYAARAADGLRVIGTVGFEVEMHMGYSALHRFLFPVMKHLDGLPDPQQRALRTAFGLIDDVQPELFLVGLAALSLLSAAARSVPVVCIVDDAQWIDRESLDVLAFVARRVDADRLILLFGVRDSAEHAILIHGIDDIVLGGLSDAHARELLATIGAHGLDPAIIKRLIAQTNGNPLAICELVGVFTKAELTEQTLRPEPIPLGPQIEAQFLAQVRDLPRATQRVLVLAAAESSGDKQVIERAMKHMEIGRFDSTLDEVIQPAIDRGLVTVGPKVAFRHPLTRSAMYGGAKPAERRAAHRALAEALGVVSDGDRSIWHLAAATTGRDDTVADGVAAAADRTRQRSGFAAASSLLVRSAELTVDPERRAARLLLAAEDALTSAQPLRTLHLVEMAVPDIHDPAMLGKSKLLQGRALTRSAPHSATAVLLEASNILAPLDRVASREALLNAIEAKFACGGPHTEVDVAVAQAALRDPESRQEQPAAVGLLLEAYALRIAEGYVAAAPVFRRALQALVAQTTTPHEVRWSMLATAAAVELWDNNANLELTTRFIGNARQQGNLHSLWHTLRGLSQCEQHAGRFDSADDLLAQAKDVASAVGDPQAAFFINVHMAAWRGRTEQVRSQTANLFAVADMVGAGVFRTIAFTAITILEIGHGRFSAGFDAAWQVFRENSISLGNHSIGDVIEAGVRCGETEAVAEALARLEERAQASGTPLALGLLARSRALTGANADAEALFLEALDNLRVADAAPELGRTRLLFGEWLAHLDRPAEAEAQLRNALDLFSRMGALGFAGRTEAALASLGAVVHQRADSAPPILTRHEQRVAALAANGLTNAEIGSQLFVSVATVEFHLSKVYRKLGVTSRRQLPHALAPRPDEP